MFQINIVAVFCLDGVDVFPQMGNDSNHSLLETCIHTEQCFSLFLFQVRPVWNSIYIAYWNKSFLLFYYLSGVVDYLHVDIMCMNVDTQTQFLQVLLYNMSQDITSLLLMTILSYFLNLRGIRTDLFCLWLKFVCSCNFAFLVITYQECDVQLRCSRAVLALRHWQSLRHETAVSRAETWDVRGRGALCLCTHSTSSEWTIWICVRVNGAICLMMSQIEDK